MLTHKSTFFLLFLLIHPIYAQSSSSSPAYPIPTSRFHLRDVTFSWQSNDPSRTISKSLTGSARQFSPYNLTQHPRVLLNPSEWSNIIKRYAQNGPWSAEFLRHTINSLHHKDFIKTLVQLQTDGKLDAFDGRPWSSDSSWNIYKSQLKPIADLLKRSDEFVAHSFFLCAFWAQVGDKSTLDAHKDDSRIPTQQFCVNAMVAWSKVLLSHRAVHCNPTCDNDNEDSEKAYLWNINKFWAVSNDWYTIGSSLALGYDLMYDQISVPQRRLIRSALTLLVMKRWTWGISLNTTATGNNVNGQTHPHRAFSNWALYHSNLYLIHLSIEEEVNTSEDVLPYTTAELNRHDAWTERTQTIQRFEGLISAWWTHSLYPDGVSFEDGYTYHTALREGTLGLLALHRRGVNMLDTPRFRNMIHAVLQQYEPWFCAPLVGHSSGGGHVYPAYIGFIRFMYPTGVLPRLVWAQQTGKTFDNGRCRFMWMQVLTQLALFGDDHADEIVPEAPAELPALVKKDFPLAWLSPRRGLLVTRGSHAQTASYMHFDARPDSFFPGHDNADRGVVTFSALGRRWLDDLPWDDNLDSRRHSLVHVDGLAQTLKAPSVTIIKAKEYGTVAIAAADLTYAYNVQWGKSWQGPNSGRTTNDEYQPDGSVKKVEYSFTDPETNSPWALGWPMEDDANDIGFFENMTLNGYDYIGFAGMYQWRRLYREELLKHVIRSTVMVRSAHNEVGFAIIVDSVEATSPGHTFESYLILEQEINVDNARSSCTNNKCLIALTSPGDEKLDIHVRTQGNNLDYRTEQFDSNKRLILKTTGGQNEEFWIALHSYTTDNNSNFRMHRENNGVVKFEYHGEERHFEVSDTDHTVIQLSGNNNIPVATVQPMVSPTASLIPIPTPIVTPEPIVSSTAIVTPEPSVAMLDEDIDLSLTTLPEPSLVATSSMEPSDKIEMEATPEMSASPVASEESEINIDDVMTGLSESPEETVPEDSMLPMKPKPLSTTHWSRVATDELNDNKAQFLVDSSSMYQIVFNITSQYGDGFMDRLTTCGPYSRGMMTMKIFDCDSYYQRECTEVIDDAIRQNCVKEGSNGQILRVRLIAGKSYLLVIDIDGGDEEKPRLGVGHNKVAIEQSQ